VEKLLQIPQIHNPHSGNKKNNQKIIEDNTSKERQKRKDACGKIQSCSRLSQKYYNYKPKIS